MTGAKLMRERRIDKTTINSWLNYPVGAAIGILLAVAVFASIWSQEYSQWHVDPDRMPLTGLESLRTAPERRILDELSSIDLKPVRLKSRDVLTTADGLLEGKLLLPGFTAETLTLPFAEQDLFRNLPVWQLAFASLTTVDILLDAYQLTRREEYFNLARNILGKFAAYEASQWRNQAFLWNDHAIAARIQTLIKFWAEYRQRPDYDPTLGRAIVHLVARSAEMLAKPEQYAWRTGHGIVSDLALLQITAAFPTLPGGSRYRAVATERLGQHMVYFVPSEGATLLHSALYHVGGMNALGKGIRLYTLNGVAVPEDWWERYSRAIGFSELLRRPDGTLPMFGDTRSDSEPLAPIVERHPSGDGPLAMRTMRDGWSERDAIGLYPLAGHAVWWYGTQDHDKSRASQTLVTWSYHPGLGHKLADELSMITWAGGRTWVTNSGYWPYGLWGRSSAESWEGSNAPHLVDESAQSERESRLLGNGRDSWATFVDVERTGPAGYIVRRQIVHLPEESTWLVLDHTRDSSNRTTATTWTFYPDLIASVLEGSGRYRVSTPNSSATLYASISGSERAQTRLVSGSKAPFAGWVVIEHTPTPAPAILLRQPSQDSRSLATFTVYPDATRTADAAAGGNIVRWKHDDDWEIVVVTARGHSNIRRNGNRLLANHSAASPPVEMTIRPIALPAAELAEVREAVLAASKKYPRFAELISYRIRMSCALLVLLVMQETVLFAMRRKLPRATATLRLASCAAWAIGGIWLYFVYFKVS